MSLDTPKCFPSRLDVDTLMPLEVLEPFSRGWMSPARETRARAGFLPERFVV